MSRLLFTFLFIMVCTWQVHAEEKIAYSVLDCTLKSYRLAAIDEHDYIPALDENDPYRKFQALLIERLDKKPAQFKAEIYGYSVDLYSSDKQLFTGQADGSWGGPVYILFNSKDRAEKQKFSMLWIEAKNDLAAAIYEGECTKGQVF